MKKVIKIIRGLVLSAGLFYLLSLFFTKSCVLPTAEEKKVFTSDLTLGCITTGTIERNQTLAFSLFKKGLPAEVISDLTQSLSKVLDLRKCKPGDFFTLLATADHSLLSFEYHKGFLEKYKVVNKEGDLVAYSVSVKLTRIVKG